MTFLFGRQLPYKAYRAHGSYVTKVVFTSDGSHLISTGGLDGMTCQVIFDSCFCCISLNE
jgi:hypothetical protein